MTPEEKEELTAKLSDKRWRLENLYLILDENGETKPLTLRGEQEQFLNERHSRNFIPKARKLGMSTIIVLDNGDECIFNADMRTGIIDLSESDAHDKLEIFRFAWTRGPLHPDPAIATLWRKIHEVNPLKSDSKGRMEWANGSLMSAGVSYTGKTPQRLHISEYGPISAQFPEKATRIKRGSINAVPPDGIVDIETTMEGGEFGECNAFFQLALGAEGKKRSKMDWKLHFFSWLNHPSYVLHDATPLANTTEYFAKLEKNHGLIVPIERQAWYSRKKREQQEDMWQQYPTVIEECTMRSIPGQIYPEMKTVRAEGRVCKFNPEKGYPRFTCWDLGSSDNMAGWEVQPAGKAHNFLAWCAGEGGGAAGVAEVIRQWEDERGPHAGHFVPHDANLTDKGSGKTYVEQLVEAGIPRTKIIVVPRIPDLWVGVGEVRKILPNCWFHESVDVAVEPEGGAKLPGGVGRIEGYKKKIDKSTGIARDVPVKDLCDHTADALRTYAEALSNDLVKANVSKPVNQAVTVVTGFRGTGQQTQGGVTVLK